MYMYLDAPIDHLQYKPDSTILFGTVALASDNTEYITPPPVKGSTPVHQLYRSIFVDLTNNDDDDDDKKPIPVVDVKKEQGEDGKLGSDATN